MKVAVVLLACVALAVTGAADSATPRAYRAQVNGICRGYTPTARQLEAELQRAAAAHDSRAYGIALGKLLVLGIQQDRRVEAVPVPTELVLRMTPILARMRKIDGHAAKALADARRGDAAGMLTELRAISTLATPLNGQLDGAGLVDCGSKQG